MIQSTLRQRMHSSYQDKLKARKLPKRGRVARSAVALAKTKSTDGTNHLPVGCLEVVPRPFASDTLGAVTLRSYEQYRGLKSRDYAMKCLLVVGCACYYVCNTHDQYKSFSYKWLHSCICSIMVVLFHYVMMLS